jgi:hypothetical protein
MGWIRGLGVFPIQDRALLEVNLCCTKLSFDPNILVAVGKESVFN